jgi:hypothetical protein
MSTEISTTRTTGGLALASFDDAFRFAKMVAGSEFAPKDFKNKPESCMLAIQHGSEVGLSPMQSLQSIAVINGRPTIWGDAALALVQSSPVCEYVKEYFEGEGKTFTAVCEAKRRGYPSPTVSRFSVTDAEKAGLLGKSGPWSQYRDRMLQLRARGFALRNAFADALRGLITAEEAQDYPQPVASSEPVVVRPKFDNEPRPSRVVLQQPKPAAPEITDPAGKARLAISAAETLTDLDKIRDRIASRLKDGTFTKAVHDELVGLAMTKAEILINAEDNGTEFPHEAAQHEVTA